MGEGKEEGEQKDGRVGNTPNKPWQNTSFQNSVCRTATTPETTQSLIGTEKL